MRLLFTICMLAGQAAAQSHVLPPAQVVKIKRGMEFVYGLEYAQAAKTFNEMIAADPADPAGYAYLAFVYWAEELHRKQELSIDRFAASDFFAESTRYKVFVHPDVEARFMKTSQHAIDRARDKLRANPSDKAALFIAGIAFQNIASFEAALKRNWWSAFRNGSHTHRYHRELLSLQPGFTDALLSAGVFNYVAGSLDWKVKWVSLLMGYRGRKERGKEQLLTAANKGILVADDARLSLVLIYTRERQFRQAYDLLAGLHKRFPQNYLLQLDMGGIALEMGNAQLAIDLYQDALRKRSGRVGKYSEIDQALLYNRIGVAYRAKKDYTAAAQWFEKALASGPGTAASSTVARLELGKTLDRMGRRTDAIAYYRQVAAAPDYVGSQSEARGLLLYPF